MSLRIFGEYVSCVPPHVGIKAPVSMRELLVESTTQLSREVNFKTVFACCDSNARAAEQPKISASVQDKILQNNNRDSSETTAENVIKLHFLRQSDISRDSPG